MKFHTISILFFLSVLFVSCEKSDVSEKQTNQRIWYNEPATSWMTEALPIGNGYMGAMFFGGVEEERIQFNEESLWSGGKGEWEGYNGGNREGAHEHLPEVRRLLKEGKFDEAHQLANRELTGEIKQDKGNSVWEGYGAYQAFGDVLVRTGHSGEVENYIRELDISEAIGRVSYDVGGVNFSREYFASYPKRAIVMQHKNTSSEGTDYTVDLTSVHQGATLFFEDNQLILSGMFSNNGMAYEGRMLVKSDGKVTFSEGKLSVKSAKKLTLLLTAATDYLNEYPDYSGRDHKALNRKTIKALKGVNYQDLKEEHITDYSSLFSRVSFQLGDVDREAVPTNQRLKEYASGGADPSLEALYFQYGRYLMVSSSRPGTLPANLQGKWNDKTNPPWASDYHANINIQMIYWPVEVTNLSECHEPLIEYIDRLRAPGRKTAKDFFNTRGWVVNTMNNAFGFTAPGWSFPWGFFPGGAAWYGRHVWEHYEFTGDEEYLRSKGYPIMKEAALFWLDYLTKDENGYLVSSPSYSPEHGGISTGAYMDIQIAYDIFSNCIQACDVLGGDEVFRKQLIETRERLLPLKIGKWGQLQEWKEDRDDPDNKHRHVSHLYALHPGNQISVADTPKLADAAKVSLNARGDDGTGWSIAWKINFWSRLLDGNHAYKLLRRAMQFTSDDGVNMMDGGGVYANMFSTHPPFQLDGNMGATAGMAEMLVQSHTNTVHILPALPDAWPTGQVKGLKTRGGFEIDIDWKDGKLNRLVIKSTSTKMARIKYGQNEIELEVPKGEFVKLTGNLEPL